MIYFIAAGDKGPVKIGYTGSASGVEQRRSSLQTGNAEKLSVLGIVEGTQTGENKIHKALAGARLQGEWFERGPAIAMMDALLGAEVGGPPGTGEPKVLNARSRRSEHVWRGPLSLYWEIDGDPISDGYIPTEMPAWDLLWEWVRLCVRDRKQVPIYWFVVGPGFCEAFPMSNDGISGKDYYSSFEHPTDDLDREVEWLDLPVVDKHWNKTKGDKGGFIQEACGWKPSPLQQTMDVELVLRGVYRYMAAFRAEPVAA